MTTTRALIPRARMARGIRRARDVALITTAVLAVAGMAAVVVIYR